MLKLSKVGNSYRVTILIDMITDLGCKEGEILRVGLEQNKLTIRKE
jgi:antitoxin component of MazEF toxin-antitoxin module